MILTAEIKKQNKTNKQENKTKKSKQKQQKTKQKQKQKKNDKGILNSTMHYLLVYGSKSKQKYLFKVCFLVDGNTCLGPIL